MPGTPSNPGVKFHQVIAASFTVGLNYNKKTTGYKIYYTMGACSDMVARTAHLLNKQSAVAYYDSLAKNSKAAFIKNYVSDDERVAGNTHAGMPWRYGKWKRYEKRCRSKIAVSWE